MAADIKLPELGDGIESGDVLNVLVSEGDTVEIDQSLLEIETDKATVEIPATKAGKITKVHVKPGDTVKIGAALVTVDSADSGKSSSDAPAKPAEKPAAAEPVEKEPAAEEQEAAAPEPAPEKPAKKAAPAPKTQKPAPAPQPAEAKLVEAAGIRAATAPTEDDTIAAGPAIRRFAREVGVDLARVTGSGPNGRITREDVVQVVRQANLAAQGSDPNVAAMQTVVDRTVTPPGAEDEDAWGPVRVEKMTKIRKTIAAKMHESWSTIPRVTNFDDADVTDLEAIRQKSKKDYAAAGIKLTTMPFLIKAVAMALKAHPIINAALDPSGEQIIYKEYVNVGIAVDTDRGLVVPALRNVDVISIPEIARNLSKMADKVRDGSFSIDDLRGGTFTISNLGAIGGTYSTPIINSPEVAILLVGRSRKMPIVIEGEKEDKIAIRLMMPLSISYDHRLVDGAAAARFLNEVKGYLEAPSRLLLAP